MSWLIHEVRRRVTEHEPETILQRLGYQAEDERALARLKRVVADDELALSESGFDFHYDSRGFALALCVALGINELSAEAEIDQLVNACFENRWAFRPYLFVDTGFKRGNEPVFALAACESMRRVPFTEDFWRLPLAEQLASVRQTILEHFAANPELRLWGKVQRYLFYFAEHEALIFSPQAEILGEHRRRPDQASLTGIERVLSASDENTD